MTFTSQSLRTPCYHSWLYYDDFKLHFIVYMCMTMGACHSICAQVREQLLRVRSSIMSPSAFLHWTVLLACNWVQNIITTARMNLQTHSLSHRRTMSPSCLHGAVWARQPHSQEHTVRVLCMTAVLNLPVTTLLEVKQPSHRVTYQISCIPDIYITIHNSSKITLRK